jgi:ABC-2 type transport system permease protein
VKALVIATTNLRRIFRQRENLFFLAVLPLLIILLLGAAFGGQDRARLGLVHPSRGSFADEVVRELRGTASLRVVDYSTASAAESAVSHGTVQAALLLPAGLDATLRAGDTGRVAYLARPDAVGASLRPTVEASLAGVGTIVRAARLLEVEHLARGRAAIAVARRAIALTPPIVVHVTTAGATDYPAGSGRFARGASTQLLLFVFFTSLTGAGALIESRRLGVLRRMLATPTSAGSLLLGEGLGRYLIAVAQALIIILGSYLLFGVHWGQPLAVTVLVLVFCLVGAGAGMLIGSVLSSEQQAAPVSFLAGLGLAALGGCMVPLEVFPTAARRVAHLTPHAWGNDAFVQLVGHHRGLTAILPQLAVLMGYAVVLLTLATWRLRRVLTA